MTLLAGLPLFSQITFTGGNLAIGAVAAFNVRNAIPFDRNTSCIVLVTGLAALEPSSLLLFAGALALAGVLRFRRCRLLNVDHRSKTMP